MHYVSESLQEDAARDLPADEPIPEWCIAADPSLQYVPKDLYSRTTPSFYRGYVLVMENIMQILMSGPGEEVQSTDGNEKTVEPHTQSSSVPTVSAVSALIKLLQNQAVGLSESLGSAKPKAFCDDGDAIRSFLDAGGKVEYALEAIIDRAQEKSPVGSEYQRDASVREEEADFENEIRELPQCVHDLDFDLVREKLGLPKRTGPSWYFISDEESADDDEEPAGDEVVYEGTQSTASEGSSYCTGWSRRCMLIISDHRDSMTTPCSAVSRMSVSTLRRGDRAARALDRGISAARP